MSSADAARQLKIKTGIVRRLYKDYQSYVKETAKEEASIAKMKAECANEDDEYKIKKANEALQETKTMIGDSARRCLAAVEDLKKLIEGSSFEDSEQLQEAQKEIEQASTLISV